MIRDALRIVTPPAATDAILWGVLELRIDPVDRRCHVIAIEASLDHHLEHEIVREVVGIWMIIFSPTFNSIAPLIPYFSIDDAAGRDGIIGMLFEIFMIFLLIFFLFSGIFMRHLYYH